MAVGFSRPILLRYLGFQKNISLLSVSMVLPEMVCRFFIIPSSKNFLNRSTTIARFHKSTFNTYPSVSVETDVNSTETHSEKKLVKKYKVNQGGDINMVAILGTLNGIKFFPMQSKPEREWAVLFIRTRSMRTPNRPVSDSQTTPTIVDLTNAFSTSPSPEDPTQSTLYQYTSTSARVHVFDSRIMHNARRAKVGDRLFVSGFLSYYNRPMMPGLSESSSESSETRAPKICAVVAQRIVFMGQDPVEDLVPDQTQETAID